MAGNYSLPLTTECDADSPLNETLFNTRLRGTLLGLGYANSVFGTFAGSGANTTTGPTTTGNLDCGAAGKQYTSWSIPAGVTITLIATGGVHRIGVTGTFTLEGTLSADGKGGAGGTLAGGAAEDGHDALAVAHCGNGGAGGGGGVSGDSSYNDHFGRPGFSYTDGYNATLNQVYDMDEYGETYNTQVVGWHPEVAGGVGLPAATGVLGCWYGNPCVLGPGAGGGGGGADRVGNDGAAGGAGGGLIIIECDTFVFASGAVITADGAAGGNDNNMGGGSGGGGGGGTVVVICRVLTTNQGTVTVTGGAGGSRRKTAAAGGAGRYAIVVLGKQAEPGGTP